jgi:hypothetical protein
MLVRGISRERILLTPIKQSPCLQPMLDIELSHFFRRKASASEAFGLRDNSFQKDTRLSSSVDDPLTCVNREWSNDIIPPSSDLGQVREYARLKENLLHLGCSVKHPRGDGSLIKYCPFPNRQPLQLGRLE